MARLSFADKRCAQKLQVPRDAFRGPGFSGLTGFSACGSRWLLLIGCALFWCGCAATPPAAAKVHRPFVFAADTFAYPNELIWEYHFDETGKRKVTRRQPAPEYAHHCFVVARAARQFFQQARFDAAQPVADEATYRRLIRRVMAQSPRRRLPEQQRIVIPGFANLREFSQAREQLLKAECGGAYQSYFQRGHWRMVFPFSREHQESMARQLARSLAQNRPPVVHLLRFPKLSINHAIVLFGVAETATELQFEAYDPNRPEQPASLIYDRAQQTFLFPRNNYFNGGRVDVYEIYSGWNY